MEVPHSKVGRRFFIITLLLTFWGITEALSLSGNLLWTRFSYVPLFVIPSSFYHLNYHLSERRMRTPLYLCRLICLPLIFLLFTNLFIKPSPNSAFELGTLFPYMGAAHITMIILGVLLLYNERMKLKYIGGFHSLDTMIVGFATAMVFIYWFEFFSPFFRWGLPRIGSVFTVFGTVAFRYSYTESSPIIYPTEQKTLTVKDALCGARCSLCSSSLAARCPGCAMVEEEKREQCRIYACAKEKKTSCPSCGTIQTCSIFAEYKRECPFSDPLKLLPPGSYRMDSSTYIPGRTAFRDRVVRGDFGLIVSRQHPDIILETWDLEPVPVLWLSIAEDASSFNPTDLPRLVHTVCDFIQEYPLSCVLFEGIEYLVIHNTFETIMKCIYSIDDRVVQQKCIFILSYDSRAFNKENLALLEKELKPVPESYSLE